jgi:protein-disulfide isomerase
MGDGGMRLRWGGPLAAALLLATSGMAGAAESLTPAQKQAVEQVVRDYLLAHPELVRDALIELQRRQEADQLVSRQVGITEIHEYVATLPADYVKGDPKAATAIIEFFDYRCPYCKAVVPRLEEVIAEDKAVRVVLIEFPILGDDSLFASRAAIASRAQGKYLVFHDAMMAHKGSLDQDKILELAKDSGIDVEKLKADMQAPEVDALIRRHHELAEKLGVNGTPAFVIGQELVPGAVDAETMKAKIKQARQS